MGLFEREMAYDVLGDLDDCGFVFECSRCIFGSNRWSLANGKR